MRRDCFCLPIDDYASGIRTFAAVKGAMLARYGRADTATPRILSRDGMLRLITSRAYDVARFLTLASLNGQSLSMITPTFSVPSFTANSRLSLLISNFVELFRFYADAIDFTDD